MPNNMRVSEKGRREWKSFEGVRLEPYICPAGKWTVGVGRRLYPTDKIEGLTFDGKKWAGQITPELCEKLFTEDVAKYERYVNQLVDVPLAQHQFDALCLFAENVGTSAFGNSTLRKLLNKKSYALAQAEFTRWVKDDNGSIIPGLVCRRQLEAVMFAGRLN